MGYLHHPQGSGQLLHKSGTLYVTVQLIVLADSGCRVYMRSRSMQTTYTFGGKHPTKVVGSGTNRCIVKVPDPLSCGTRDYIHKLAKTHIPFGY